MVSIINYLNSKFNQHGIFIVNNGYDYIDNTANYNIKIDGTNFNYISSLSYDSTSFNFYINNFVSQQPFASSIGGTKIFMNQSTFLNQNATQAHELGHTLGLYHTFHGTNPNVNDQSGCVEETSGSNCLSCGDFVCDTPSTNCNGTNGCIEDDTNFMDYQSAYSPPLNHLTLGQGTRMRNWLQSYHQERLSYQCKKIDGDNSMCNFNSKSFSITPYVNTIPTILWSVSSNLQIISSTSGTSVTVQAANATFTDVYGTLTLLINGTTLTKQIWIGAPNGNVYTPIIGAHDWVCRGITTNNVVSIANNPTAIFYRWKIEIDTTFGLGYNCNGVTNPSFAKFNSNQSMVLVNAPEYTDSNGTVSTSINVPTYTDYSTTPSTSINWGRCSGNYRLSLYAKNACGETLDAVKYVTVGSPPSNP